MTFNKQKFLADLEQYLSQPRSLPREKNRNFFHILNCALNGTRLNLPAVQYLQKIIAERGLKEQLQRMMDADYVRKSEAGWRTMSVKPRPMSPEQKKILQEKIEKWKRNKPAQPNVPPQPRPIPKPPKPKGSPRNRGKRRH